MYQKKYVATRIGCSGGIDSYLKTIRYVGVQEESDYNRYFFLDDDKNVTVDYYKLPHHLILVKVTSQTDDLTQFVPEQTRNTNKKGLIDVTHHEYYQSHESIIENIQPFRMVVEGAKGTGKSSIVRYFISKGIVAQDRDPEVFSNPKLLKLSKENRTKKVYQRIHKNKDEYFLLVMRTAQHIESALKRRTDEKNTKDHEAYRKAYQEAYISLNKAGLLDGKIKIMHNDFKWGNQRNQYLRNMINQMMEKYPQQKVKAR